MCRARGISQVHAAVPTLDRRARAGERNRMPVRKVLVVDDEDSTRAAVRFMLEDAGYEVSEAPNGIVALDLLHAATEPMVVLLDLMMPGMSGLRLLQIVGSEPELAARHDFILFTAARA